MMITQEQFTKIEYEHGCGYWNICWEHACPCAITAEHKGLQESIWNGMVEENEKMSEEEFNGNVYDGYEDRGWNDEEDFYDDFNK